MSETTLLTDGQDPTAAAQGQQADAQAANGQQPAGEGTQQAQQTAADQQTADAAKGEGKSKGEEGKADEATKAAVEYTDFTMPEGVGLDTDTMSEFKDLAKEAGLPQEAAQKFVDLGVKMAQKLANQPQEILSQARQEWATQTKTDKEFGGDQLQGNLAVAKKAMDAFATPAFKDLLNQSGLGDHPEVIRVFFRAGKALSEDALIVGARTPAGAKSPAEVLYGNNNQ